MGKEMRDKRHYNHYDDAQKKKVLYAYVNTKKGIYKLSEEFGIPSKTIYLWIKQAKVKKKPIKPILPFNMLAIVTKGDKVVELKELAYKDEAYLYKKKMERKGCEVEIRQLAPIKRTIPKFPVGTGHGKHWCTPVQCIETGKIFKSASDCGETMNISVKSIYKSLREGSHAGGYHFKYFL